MSQKDVILVTGSTGLIGSRLCRDLAPQYTVVGLDVKPPDPKQDLPHDVHWLQCDLTDDASVGQALKRVAETHGTSLASVIHLAAYYDFSGEPSPLYQQLTVNGTRRLLTRLQQFDVGQFVFTSSLLVMKPTEDLSERMTEHSPVQAEWDYPRSKLNAEAAIREHRGNIPVVILRVAGVYDEDCRSIPIAQQIRRIYEKSVKSYFFPGNTNHGQSFIHLSDLIDCIRRVVERRGELSPDELFLIGEEDLMTYGELQHAIGSVLYESGWPTVRVPKLLAKAGAWVEEQTSGEDEQPFIKPWMVDLADAHYPVDISRARDRLGWQPKRFLRMTLPTILRRLRENPVEWYKLNNLALPADLAAEREHATMS